jgi:hypothetical protein
MMETLIETVYHGFPGKMPVKTEKIAAEQL